MVTPAPDISTIKGIGNFFPLDNGSTDTMSVLVPNTGLKSAGAASSLLDVPIPEIQTPNNSTQITTTAPTIQVFPEGKGFEQNIEGE